MTGNHRHNIQIMIKPDEESEDRIVQVTPLSDWREERILSDKVSAKSSQQNKTSAADVPQNHLLEATASLHFATAYSPAPSLFSPTHHLAMVNSRLFRPASRVLAASRPTQVPYNSAFKPAALPPFLVSRRKYASPSGVKEVAVRDALNEALAEELESSDKVFVLGEEVAQYNGA